ncbi:hypothetical protein KI387_000143, partial [Taxus chinensis]
MVILAQYFKLLNFKVLSPYKIVYVYTLNRIKNVASEKQDTYAPLVYGAEQQILAQKIPFPWEMIVETRVAIPVQSFFVVVETVPFVLAKFTFPAMK